MSQQPSLLDRVFIGLLNAFVALLTGVLLWIALNGFPWAVVPWLPAVSILWFTLIMTVLSLLIPEVTLLNFYGKCWRVLVYWYKGGN